MRKEKQKIDGSKKEFEQEVRELSEEEMNQVSGGGAFDSVPRVDEYNYTDDIRERT